MFEAFKQRGWRGAIGLVAAYAFVLQAFLTYSIATQAAAHGSNSGSFFVICVNDDGAAAADGAGTPLKPTTHCPVCTLSDSSAAAAPDPVALLSWPPAAAKRTLFVTAQACIHFHQARAGLTRAPPQNA